MTSSQDPDDPPPPAAASTAADTIPEVRDGRESAERIPRMMAETSLALRTGADTEPRAGTATGTGSGTGTGGYEIGEVLGRGGMGEVVLARDPRIGRDVAIKRMRGAEPDVDSVARFLREARIQARLQHPAIVPVHELGTDAAGRPYFTMKRLAGVTLHTLIVDGAPQQRLLRALVDVCLAIEFAHKSGVVHRDLKPVNIMLGDFGEVYVLDWGIARVLDESAANVSAGDIATAPGQTLAGAVLGTPGYMSPEQVAGEPVGPASDVYALGTILFEILTGESLHPRTGAALAMTLARSCEAPSARNPALPIPPELDAACVATLAEAPADRPTARELADRIQRYLDGDRDLERRRTLAGEHLARANAALASGDPARRADAVREAGRALALDPESKPAAELVTSFLVEPPRVLPDELIGSLAEAERDASRVRSKKAIVAFLAGLGFVVLVPWVKIKSWPLLVGFFGALAGMGFLSWRSYKRGRIVVPVAMVSTLIAIAMFSRLIGPFILTPVFTSGILLAVVMIPSVAERGWLVVGFALVAALCPVVLELVGVFSRTWVVGPDGLLTRSPILYGVPGLIEPIALVVANTFYITILAMFARAVGRDRHTAQRDLHVQAWHLRQLLPR